jgi:hypothetical protein
MSNSYTLVNPFIHGDFKNTVKSKNSVNAAKTFYKNLSEHFNNNIPKFYFTIQKGGSGNGKYYHFLVKETKGDNDEVKFKVESYNISNEEANLKVFKNKLVKFKSKFEQAGGKKAAKKGSKKGSKAKKSIDDDSDLDSSEDFYRRAQTYKPVVTPPLYYWWYDPGVYGLDSVFVPTFYSYVTPYIQYSLGGYVFY